MAARLLLTPEMHLDLDDAYLWYENRGPGLGAAFLDSVANCIESILKMPEMHERVQDDYRRALVRTVPYAVIYDYVGDYVTIYAVFHTARNPAEWRKRLS